MEKHPIGDLTEVTLSKIKEMVDVNTVVGTPITTPDGITLIPVSRVSLGFANAGSDLKSRESAFGGGNGAGIKIEPVGFLCIQDGGVRMINIGSPASTSLDRLIEIAPEMIDKGEQLYKKYKNK
jgi:sporulation protein YtfJ